MENIFIVNHRLTDACGVYKHGSRMAHILRDSSKYKFIEVRANSFQEFHAIYKEYSPKVCFYNYYPSNLGWAPEALGLPSVHVGLAHEVTHASASHYAPPFNQWVATDPSFPASPYYFKTVRPLLDFQWNPSFRGLKEPDIPTIGSFGFAFPNKGFDKVIDAVCNEFDEAKIRLHITVAAFNGGYDQGYINHLVGLCHSKLTKPGIQLEITTDFRGDNEIIRFLSENSLNVLFYDFGAGRGISSAVDYCVSAGRPLAISSSEQFRHITDTIPTYPARSLKDTLLNGQEGIDNLQKEWSHSVFINQYEDIVERLLKC